MANDAKRTMYLHIGTPKTGTSALQFDLNTAREELRSHGLLSLFGVKLGCTGLQSRRNLSLTREMAELLRSTNATFDNRKRDCLIAEMEKALEADSGREATTTLSPVELRTLMNRYRECNALL